MPPVTNKVTPPPKTSPACAATRLEPARPALQRAEGEVYRLEIREMAQRMLQLFGRDLTAIITGVDHPRTVAQWAKGLAKPHPDNEQRLRDALLVATFLEFSDEEPVAVRSSWFLGMNHALEDRAPARVVQEDPQAVLGAAKTFAQERF